MDLVETLRGAAEYARGITAGGLVSVVVELHPLGFRVRVDAGEVGSNRLLSYEEVAAGRINLLMAAIGELLAGFKETKAA